MSKPADEKKDVWFAILSRQHDIYTNISEKLKSTDDYAKEMSLLRAKGDNITQEEKIRLKQLISLKQIAAFNQSIGKHPVKPDEKVKIADISAGHNLSSLYNDPCAAYILNIEEGKAKKIQDNYGVICQSSSCLDDSILTGEGIERNPKFGEGDYGWKRILRSFKHIPCNSLLINDRNLFSNDDVSDENKKYGFKNVFEILEFLIPSRLNDGAKFHVFICSDEESLEKHNSFEDIVAELEKTRRDLIENRNHRINIDIEFFCLTDKNSVGYTETHNRRILGNYFVFTLDYKIAAFKDNYCRCTQNISGKKLFHTGLYDDNDTAEKLHRDLIMDFKDFIGFHEKGTAKQKGYLYAINGEIKDFDTCKVVNRILKNN